MKIVYLLIFSIDVQNVLIVRPKNRGAFDNFGQV